MPVLVSSLSCKCDVARLIFVCWTCCQVFVCKLCHGCSNICNKQPLVPAQECHVHVALWKCMRLWHFSANLLLPTNILHMQVCSTRKLLPSQYIDIPRDASWRQFGRFLEKVCQTDEGKVVRFSFLSSSSMDVDPHKHACLWNKVTTVNPS